MKRFQLFFALTSILVMKKKRAEFSNWLLERLELQHMLHKILSARFQRCFAWAGRWVALWKETKWDKCYVFTLLKIARAKQCPHTFRQQSDWPATLEGRMLWSFINWLSWRNIRENSILVLVQILLCYSYNLLPVIFSTKYHFNLIFSPCCVGVWELLETR